MYVTYITGLGYLNDIELCLSVIAVQCTFCMKLFYNTHSCCIFGSPKIVCLSFCRFFFA